MDATSVLLQSWRKMAWLLSWAHFPLASLIIGLVSPGMNLGTEYSSPSYYHWSPMGAIFRSRNPASSAGLFSTAAVNLVLSLHPGTQRMMRK